MHSMHIEICTQHVHVHIQNMHMHENSNHTPDKFVYQEALNMWHFCVLPYLSIACKVDPPNLADKSASFG